MKHTTEELALSAAVMRMAAEARNGALPFKLPAEEQKAWLEANPLIGFVPEVMRKLDEVADTISAIRASKT